MACYLFNGVPHADNYWLDLLHADGSRERFEVKKGQHIELSDAQVAAVKRGPGGPSRLDAFAIVVRPPAHSEPAESKGVERPKGAASNSFEGGLTQTPNSDVVIDHLPAPAEMTKAEIGDELDALGVEFNKRDNHAVLAETLEAARAEA